jgi:hypothetical protein
MGCGPSRRASKSDESKLATDCSGSICNIKKSDISDNDIIDLMPDNMAERIVPELYLMKYDVLKQARDILYKDKTFMGEIRFGVVYKKLTEYINENGVDITPDEIKLLNLAAPWPPDPSSPSPISTQFKIITETMDTIDNVPEYLQKFYNTHVEMLFDKVKHRPIYTPDKLNEEIFKWYVEQIRSGNISGFTNPKAYSNPLLNIIDNLKKKTNMSGFADFKPYDGTIERNRFKNDYHSF